MNRNLPAKQKAMTIRTRLMSKDVVDQLAVAVPKWLSAERLLRVTFTAIMKNPKLLDCSQESILAAVMQCAQLGLEPVLGRAHLVPYWNRGKKCYEAQFQPGYQGLVDLARRSNTISDVWGFVVCENDEFDMTYGMERRLHHRPWYMVPEKRAAGVPGESIGAYVVWQLKDGTKHPEFMPMYEIHKRRGKSPAYQWAETGDPKKGGGKQDSIWHVWPDDMAVKTVVKHSSKLVPASIEFMEAVALDDAAESGFSQIGMFASDGTLEISDVSAQNDGSSTIDADEMRQRAMDFDDMTKRLPIESLRRFLEVTAKANNTTIDALKAAASEDFNSFQAAFDRWMEKNGGQVVEKMDPDSGADGGGKDPAKVKPEDHEIAKAIYNKQTGNGKTSGLAGYVNSNKEYILKSFGECPGLDDIVREKWIRIYTDKQNGEVKPPWPFGAKAENRQQASQEAPGSTNGANGGQPGGDKTVNGRSFAQLSGKLLEAGEQDPELFNEIRQRIAPNGIKTYDAGLEVLRQFNEAMDVAAAEEGTEQPELSRQQVLERLSFIKVNHKALYERIVSEEFPDGNRTADDDARLLSMIEAEIEIDQRNQGNAGMRF